MHDIVLRLRVVFPLPFVPNREFMNEQRFEAADEIERLREDKAELLKALTDLYEACRWEKVAPEIDAAKSAIVKATGGE